MEWMGKRFYGLARVSYVSQPHQTQKWNRRGSKAKVTPDEIERSLREQWRMANPNASPAQTKRAMDRIAQELKLV
jgi:hypothetical protein